MKKNSIKENIVGIHAVRTLLKLRPFDIYELYVSDKDATQFIEITKEANKNNIAIQKISSEKIYEITNVKSHQGILAISKKKEEIFENNLINFLETKKKNQILLILDEVSDPRNFGACLRVCDAYNVSAVIVKDHGNLGMNETVRKVASGAAETVPIIRVKNISRTIQLLKKNNFWVYGATEKACDEINNINYLTPLALIIGGESCGLRKKTLELCDFTIKINMSGIVESLNMSVATGIILNTINYKIKYLQSSNP